MRERATQAAKVPRTCTAKRAASLAFALALCMAPLGLSACSSGGSSSEQATTSQETQTEAAATTEAAEEAQPIYVLSKMSHSSDGITTTRVYTYDEQGNCVSSTFDQAGESDEYGFHQEITTEYNEQGAPVSENIVNMSSESSDETPATFEATVDDTGYLTALSETYGDNNIAWTYDYNAEGGLISAAATNTVSDGGTSTSTWTLNDYGWFTEIAYNSGTDDATSTTYSYEGDDPAHPTTATETINFSASMSMEPQASSYALTYDENGNLATVEALGEDGGSVWAYEYQKIETPSVIAATAARLKMPGGGMSLF